MEAFWTAPLNAGSLNVALHATPGLRATAQAPGNLRSPGASVSSSASWKPSFGVAVAVLALAGSRQQGRLRSQTSVVKCRAVPTEAEVAKAKQEADLAAWAANNLKGSPQEAAMKAKAQAKAQAYEALTAALKQGVSAAPVAVAVAAPQPATELSFGGDVPSVELVASAKQKAELLKWAAKTLAAEGSPQAAAMQAKAAAKVKIYESLKAAFEQGVRAAPVAAAAAQPGAPQPAATVPQPAATGKVPTKEEVASAKEKADLIVWAAKALQAKGSPQAAAMQARGERKVQEYKALKSAFEKGAPVVPVAAAAAPAQPAAATVSIGREKITPEEVAKYKKEADLMVWAAKALASKGSPQAAEMQAKADAKVKNYESLKALLA